MAAIFKNDYEKEYGKIIYVKVNGVPRKTYLDKHGTQRFIPNKIVENYVRNNGELWEVTKDNNIYTHNSIGSDVQLGRVSFEDYVEFQMMHNASVEYVDSTAVQMLETLFESTQEYKDFDKEVQEKFTDEDFERYDFIDEAPGWQELYDKHFEKFMNKYYHMDNPLWD